MAEACSCGFEDCLLCGAQIASTDAPVAVCEDGKLLDKMGFAPGDVLAVQGLPLERLFFLTAGEAKVLSNRPSGRQQLLYTLGAGEVVGLEALASGIASATVTALTPIQACSISCATAEDLFATDSHTSFRGLRYLLQEREKSWERIQNLGMLGARERIAAFLLSLPEGISGSDGIPLVFSREEIGELTGLTLETVSRHMAALRRDGVIAEDRRGRIRLLDPDALRDLADMAAEETG